MKIDCSSLTSQKSVAILMGADKVAIRQGPRIGFVQNFLSMACDPSIKANYYAFCDQDNIWLHEKLQVAIDCLSQPKILQCRMFTAAARPTCEITSSHTPTRQNWSPRVCLGTRSSEVSRWAVFNQATKTLLEKTGPVPTPSHDWWLYQLVTAAAGVVYFDSKPYILYRQHPNALIGGNTSLWARIEGVGMVFKGRFKSFSDQNIECLRRCYQHITSAAREKVELFAKMRDAGFKNHMRLLEVCGLYRETWRASFSLKHAAVLIKI